MDRPVVIVGAGLAGTTLAWQLHFASAKPILFDRFDSTAASRVAAGLITPVTGKRMAVSWNWDTVWPAAEGFYRRVESVLGTTFFHLCTAIRFFQSEDERQAFHDRVDMLVPYVQPLGELDPAIRAPLGGFAMPTAAVLDVPVYLAASHEFFSSTVAEVNPTSDLELHADFVSLPRFGIEAKSVAFCQGYAGRSHPWFPWIAFNPTKGDILSLEIPGFAEDRIIHAGGWLARMADGSYRAGSTYDRDDLIPNPNEADRETIERKIRTICDKPFHVTSQRSAVRPTIRESRPVLGVHPNRPRLAYFSGLGSKGTLIAPHYAGQLAGAILGMGRVDEDVDVAKIHGTPTRLSEQAHAFVRSVVKPGETVVDATAGNGHDTVFLSHLVGPSGRVIAFDIDPQSRIETESRHRTINLPLPAFHPVSHEEIERYCQLDVAAVMFNLGYRPGGDHNRTTKPDSTIAAISAACRLLRRGGIITVTAYIVHKGGRAEAEAVRQFCDSLPTDTFAVTMPPVESERSPRLFAITKRTEAKP